MKKRIKAGQELLWTIMREERTMELKEHPLKVRGYYTRDLLTFVGPAGGGRTYSPRAGKRFPPILLYQRRTSLELSEAILALYAWRMSTRAIRNLQRVLLTSEHLSASRRWRTGECAPGGSVPWTRSTKQCFWAERSLYHHLPRGNCTKI